MSDFSKCRIHRTRRYRACDFCERSIPKGERYAYYVGRIEGTFSVAGWCMKCHEWFEKARAA